MKHKIILFLFLIGMGIILAAFFMDPLNYLLAGGNTGTQSSDEQSSDLIVDTPSGFYNKTIHINVASTDPDAIIYYTTDCSEPSDSSEKFVSPITLNADEQEQVYTIKFKYYSNQSSSDTYTYTYVMGQNISERYDTLVVSISGDEDSLFGYENGVFTEGKLRQDFLDANPDLSSNDIIASDPANYNVHGMQSERPVTVQIFDSNGDTLLTQDCGLRIFGNYSRAKAQKSFQLFARTSYSTDGNFHLSLSPYTTSLSDGTILNRINRLLFRNSGDDFNHGFIRDTLLQNLAAQSGYLFAYQDRPAAVYIDGTYSGFYWVRVPFNDGDIKNLYGDYDGQFVTLEVNDYTCSVVEDDDTEKQTELQTYTDEFQEIYDTYADGDLNDSTVLAALNQKIDIDNYLRYFAIEMYIGNKDWPYNNMKVYRYVADDDNYTPDSIFDGRYRYLLFDTDYSFGLVSNYTSYSYDEDNIAIISNNGQSPLFSNLMGLASYRAIEINYLCDLMNGAFSYDNVKSTLESLDSTRLNELNHFITDSDLVDDDVSLESVETQVDDMLEYAKNRPQYILQFIQNDFPVSHKYDVSATVPSSAQVTLNSIDDIGSSFNGTYFASCGLTLSVKTDDGHIFDHWVINGQSFSDTTLDLTESQLESLLDLSTSDTLEISLVVTDNENTSPVIYMLQSQSSNDALILSNPSDHTISTNGYYLSNSQDNLKKMEIPSTTIEAYSSIVFYYDASENSTTSKQFPLSFHLKTGETLYLSSEDGTILESVEIPDMSEDTSWYVKNLFTDTYTEQTLSSILSYEDSSNPTLNANNYRDFYSLLTK